MLSKDFQIWISTQLSNLDQHTALEALEEQGYQRLDDQTKVQHLLNGMQKKELETAKSQVWASATLQSDFDGCVDLFKTFLEQQATSSTTKFDISSTHTHGGRGHGGCGDCSKQHVE
jgi:hypothetical protein